MVRLAVAGFGGDWHGRHGKACSGFACRGSVWQAWFVPVRHGSFRSGFVRQAWFVWVSLGKVRLVVAGYCVAG